MDVLRQQVASQERELIALRAQRTTAGDHAETAALHRQPMDRVASAGQQELDAAARQLADRERQVVESRERRAALEATVARLQLEVDAARNNTQALARQVAEQQRLIADLKLVADGLRSDLSAKDREIADLLSRAGSLSRERELLQGRIATYKQSGIVHLEELHRLYAELARRTVNTPVGSSDSIAGDVG